MRMRFASALGAALAAGTVALLGSACGSVARPHAPGTASAPSPAAGATRRMPATAPTAVSLAQRYADCMRARGVRGFPNPVGGHITLTPASGIDPSSPRYESASKACAKYAPSDARPVATPAAWRGYGAWLAQQAAAGRFSGAVLVADARRRLLDAGYGLADRSARIANTPQTRFCIASIGKLFTAVAVAQLAQQGRLSFTAPVGAYVSGLPSAIARHITIAQLLDMTSGLGNVVLGGRTPPRTLAGMVALIAGERPRSEPGTRFLYSNDGYILLGEVIQRVSGDSYARYIRGHILGPAGMTHTGYRVYTPARVPAMAHGYAPAGSSVRDISREPQIANPSGGAYSTTGDLLSFARALLRHRLLSATMTRTVLAPRVSSPQPGGPPTDEYTYGFAYQRLNGVVFVGHNGGTPGYEGQIDIYPRIGDVVVVLANENQTMIPAIQRAEAMVTGA